MTTPKEKGALPRAPNKANFGFNSNRPYRKFNSGFDRSRLPNPSQYFSTQDLKLKGKGAWRDAICPFHSDTKPSLRIRIETGAFCCMSCGARGGDVLAFHMQRYGMGFKAAAIALGAWVGGTR